MEAASEPESVLAHTANLEAHTFNEFAQLIARAPRRSIGGANVNPSLVEFRSCILDFTPPPYNSKPQVNRRTGVQPAGFDACPVPTDKATRLA